MAKVALDMDMPESCSKCKFLYEFQGIKKCQLMNAFNNGASRLSQNTFTEKRHEKCPLRELPQRYQQSEEQGRLIKLPCKVGDTVYGMLMGKFTNLTVNEISIFRMKGERIINAKCQSNDEFRNYVEREFGKTVFLTKSEAEAKLKELRGAENGSME